MPPPDLMVVTDLDGTFLDHHDYSYDAALPMLERLRADDVPVVFCSSKTRAEITALQRRTGLDGQAFVAENGAIVVGPDGNGIPDAGAGPADADLARLRAALDRTRADLDLHFATFGGETDEVVAAWTGLDLAAAGDARRREASEVLLWHAEDDDRADAFREALAAAGLDLVRGGRFWHVLPAGCDKGTAVRLLVADHERRTGTAPCTIGLGDGPNDTALLDAVDLAVVVRGHGPAPGPFADDRPERVYRTTHPGPLGWSEGLGHHLEHHLEQHREQHREQQLRSHR
ncbi:mannosyl-3-phosphoglycerate phosphatase [Curtobacterium sp. PhB172]|uniref:HAD-IIB family hydrolase n=1 Tax=unclassified Curtobacterium TaxID=257496 RepID=UPI000F498E4D|nr:MULTISPECIES: HAD-IIB family hydrolase [unclassified Curtobacterium]ROQ18217.1 mannosyl-3-phosphoglycerate phosphatase [Curtobacterium sp. PhB171]ROQ30185.1 mannosyl-3-phosphoglycerate phosphatase [Curtobacterium sp. PhB170]ROS32389.1 mannosyl-3-phosphoglycerate phosphatase [Curtobacterium sp. PhB131]ROS60024.1 mannosyl-3-phosphoglycerate phosphatase [Curtobacterium sp. PhB172]ROS73490.1 mannosyl-3-phosphoglycerate phosphatase [Curtobacterium sp. PhB141]